MKTSIMALFKARSEHESNPSSGLEYTNMMNLRHERQIYSL